jgi:hypothetical protein
MNDIVIYCRNKEKIGLENISNTIIKSGEKFKRNESFSIQNTKVEGLFIKTTKINNIELVTIFYLNDCKKNGKYLKLQLINKGEGFNYYYDKELDNIEILNEKKNGRVIIDCYYKKGNFMKVTKNGQL